MKSLKEGQDEFLKQFQNQELQSHKYKWQSLGNIEKNHNVYSAYFDDRIHILNKWSSNVIGSVRVFAILDLSLSGYSMECSYKYPDGEVQTVFADESVAIEEHFDMEFASFTISCPVFKSLKGLPEKVSLQYKDNSLTYISPTYVFIR